MPDDDPGDDDDGGDTDLVEADVVDNPVAATMQTLAKYCELKWIAPTTMDELYQVYKEWGKKDRRASGATFNRVWRQHWKNKALRARVDGQHPRCTRCTDLTARIKQCHDKQELTDLEKALRPFSIHAVRSRIGNGNPTNE